MAPQNEQEEWVTEIIDGPSKYDLITSLCEDHPKAVWFKFSTLPSNIKGPKLKTSILSVKKGPLVARLMFADGDNSGLEIEGCLLGTTMTFIAIYSTKTRKGRARLIGY